MRVAWLLALAACTATGHADDVDRVRTAIGEAWRDHLAAVKRKDAFGVGRLYADDIVFIVPPGAEVRGRKAIDDMEAQGLATVEILDVTHTTEGLRVYGDLAYEIGTVVGPVRPHGKPASVVTFHYMARWKRQTDGRWRIQYLVGQPES